MSAELVVGDRIVLHFGPFASSWEVIELIPAGARLSYLGVVNFVGFGKLILAPNDTALTLDPNHAFLGRAHFHEVQRLGKVGD